MFFAIYKYLLLDFLKQIVYNSIENLIHMFGVLLSIQWVPSILGSYVPTFLATSVITVTAIGVIKLVLGWGNS